VLKIFNNKRVVFQWGLMIIFFVLMIFRPVSLEKPVLFGPLYNYIYSLLQGETWLIYTTYILLIVAEALLPQLLVARFRLISFNNYLVIFLWLILVFSNPQIASVNPVLIAGVIITWGMFRLFSLSERENPLPNLFTVGFLLSLASLVYGPVIWYFIFLLISLVILSLINWREIAVVVISFMLPYLYLYAYGFVFQTTFDYNEATSSVNPLPELMTMLQDQWIAVLVGFLVTLLALYSLLNFFMNFMYKLIQIRNYVTVLTLMLAFSSILIFFSGPWWFVHFYLIFIPLVILLAMSMADRAHSRFAEILLYLIVTFELVQVYLLHNA
jgi:hypothetical protein